MFRSGRGSLRALKPGRPGKKKRMDSGQLGEPLFSTTFGKVPLESHRQLGCGRNSVRLRLGPFRSAIRQREGDFLFCSRAAAQPPWMPPDVLPPRGGKIKGRNGRTGSYKQGTRGGVMVAVRQRDYGNTGLKDHRTTGLRDYGITGLAEANLHCDG